MSKNLNQINKKQGLRKMNLITNYRLLITSLALALTGCMGVYEGGFECPPGAGVGCKSISEVNQMIDHKELPQQKASDVQKSCEQCEADFESEQSHPEQPRIWYSPWALREV